MRKRITSLLLTLVMLLSLVPAMGVTAFAAAYPSSVTVYNQNGKLIGLSDGQYLSANNASSASTGYNGTQSYVARYDKSSGTLYLKGYHGVATGSGIVASGDLNIEVESDSSITASKTSTDDLIGIQATGKLNISGSGKLAVTASGKNKNTVYGIFAKEGVTISAPLDVKVDLNDGMKTEMYGIYTKSGAISLSGNDMTVTVTGGSGTVYGVYNKAKTSSTADNGNITIGGKLTVSLSNGKNNRGT